MPCFEPLKGYRSRTVNPTGKRSIVFNKNEGYADMPVHLPCGQCIGCRLARSKQWAVRILHEAQQHQDNAFITLTYNDENLPKEGSLDTTHFQRFMKRLRKKHTVRFFHCGEYGDKFNRPHYHACIFGYGFPDKEHYATVRGQKYYRSKELEELWTSGHSIIGDVTFESAAYVARYIVKKVTGERASWYYDEIDPETGEVLRELKPEYVTMSRRPGIGKTWLEKYKTDVFPDDFVVINGKKYTTPKYYLTQLELQYPKEYANVRAKRQNEKEKHKDENTYVRLQVRKECQEIKAERLKRNYEND